jgi:thioesterase domain-containing protein/acyl carrier protein
LGATVRWQHGDRLGIQWLPDQNLAPIEALVQQRIEEEGLSIGRFQDFLRTTLPEFMCPSVVMLMPALPLTSSGKVNRLNLPTPSQFLQGRAVQPRDEIERRLVGIWEQLLDVRPIGVTDNFFSLGGHSLLAVHLMARIEQELGCQLPLTALFAHGTVEGLAHLSRGGRVTTAKPERGCVLLAEGDPRKHLFLVHPIGGQVFCYRDLAGALAPGRTVWGLLAPGIEGDEAPLATMSALVGRHLAQVRRVQPHGPYVLGGWSFGGLVALELARRLKDEDERVHLVAVLDSTPTPSSPLRDAGPRELTRAFLEDIAGPLGKAQVLRTELASLPEDWTTQHALRVVQRIGALPAEMPLHFFETRFSTFKEVFAAHIRAMADYRPCPIDVPTALFCAARNPSSDELRASWVRLLSDVRTFTYDTDHSGMVRRPVVDRVAQDLEESVKDNETGGHDGRRG